MPKIKKQTKRRKKKIVPKVIQTNFIKIGYGTQSEKIAHSIIEKIISLTISKVHSDFVCSVDALTNRLMTYTKNIINPLIQINFMSYDDDDLFITNNNNNNNNNNSNNNNLNNNNNNMGIGDWAQSPIPNPQSPIPNPQSPIPSFIKI